MAAKDVTRARELNSMADSGDIKLNLLHSEEQLVKSKLELFRAYSTELLINSLAPGQPGSLKVRPEGTILDGNHRIKVLIERGVDINSLPRETILRYTDGGLDNQ